MDTVIHSWNHIREALGTKYFYYSPINLLYDLSNFKLPDINQVELSTALILVRFPSTKCHPRLQNILYIPMANITLHNVFKRMVVFKRRFVPSCYYRNVYKSSTRIYSEPFISLFSIHLKSNLRNMCWVPINFHHALKPCQDNIFHRSNTM